MVKALSFLGTGSDVGKSIITAATLRVFANRGILCAPYKAQNMSNNSYVTDTGGEMGRAQIVQAEAARCEPHTDMNPVLLKPSTETGSQVILNGYVYTDKNARDYFKLSQYLKNEADKSYDRLATNFDVICLEGAGSCAELNLMKRDFVNFSAAFHAKAPVILVADIDRGGVFAQVLGTLLILDKKERDQIKGIIINRFRGDISLFDDGRQMIEEQGGVPVLGVVPMLYDLQIDAEDSLPLHSLLDPPNTPDKNKISIAVIFLRSISNHTDINPLGRVPGVELHFLSKVRDLSSYDVVILPGTKNVRKDLSFLEDSGWKKEILKFKKKVFGICGGYQILGKSINDKFGIEGDIGKTVGLDLLPVETILTKDKYLARVEGECELFNCTVSGYEIHMGETEIDSTDSLLTLKNITKKSDTKYSDGSISEDGRIIGSYVHGIFDDISFLRGFLNWVSPEKIKNIEVESNEKIKERELNRLADHFEKHVDVDQLFKIMETGV